MPKVSNYPLKRVFSAERHYDCDEHEHQNPVDWCGAGLQSPDIADSSAKQ